MYIPGDIVEVVESFNIDLFEVRLEHSYWVYSKSITTQHTLERMKLGTNGIVLEYKSDSKIMIVLIGSKIFKVFVEWFRKI